ncbi:MAG: heparinase II/III family protein [Sedimentisphaerales bacterium]|nr:heparinase II/III family protein [Sedimentisphaerales bacterium]
MKETTKRMLLIATSMYVGAILLLDGFARGADGVDHARVKYVAGLLSKGPKGFGVPITDTNAWEKPAKNSSFKGVIAEAEKLLREAIPDQPDDLYLDYSRTGNRTRWQRVSGRRRGRVGTLVTAECLENKGRFIPAFEEIVRALCAERTWVMPAHDRGLTNFNGKIVDIDLGSSMLAWSLATADYLLAEKLGPDARRMIRDNLEQRIFKPYEDMVAGKRERNWWMTTTNNWNAVCLGGVTGSALAVIDSPERRAFFIVAAEQYSQNFLKGFTDDGYCSEGLGYWNYGYGYYVMLSELIHQATGGKVDILDNERAKAAGRFGAAIEIDNGIYPAFADCSVRTRPSSRLMYFVSRRFGMGLQRWEQDDPAGPGGALYESMMYSFENSASLARPAAADSGQLPIRSWFDKAGVLICRPRPNSQSQLAVALKGGHNAEHHNHNDVGSFVVVLGDNPLLLDPGSEVYTARTFSSRRYDSNVLNSFGHPVPVVAGKLQRTGGNARGVILNQQFTDGADTLVLDISSAYDAPELKKLKRTFLYSRTGPGALTVTDEAAFSKASTFGTALVTLDKWKKVGASSLMIYDSDEALQVDIETNGADFEIKAETIDEDVTAPRKPIRLGINLSKPAAAAVITLKIAPMEKGKAAGER